MVRDLDAALDHVARFGSNHTEAICTPSYATRPSAGCDEVDASCVLVNASTRFNDGGELGLGAEIGISTIQAARYGPMGLESLTTEKWIVLGDGQIRRSDRRVNLQASRRARANAQTHPAVASRSGASGTSVEPEPSRIALLCAAEAALDKKAASVEIIDVTGKVDYADYLVLMTGHSDRHVVGHRRRGGRALGKNGHGAISWRACPRASWVLIDFVDVVVHVFEAKRARLYDLDGLWMDARRIPVHESKPT